MFKTTTVGSLPKPDWLAEPEKLWPTWRLDGQALQDGKERAALEWLREQEAAGRLLLAQPFERSALFAVLQGLAVETPGGPKFFGFGEPVRFGQAAYGGGFEHRGILTTEAAPPGRA